MSVVRIMVTGSRGWTNIEPVQDQLSRLQGRFPDERHELFSGHAVGLDRIAESVAHDLGWAVRLFLPDWDRYGRSAGHRRNQAMVDAGPHRALGFVLPCVIEGCPRRPHGTHGTEGAIAAARTAGVPTRVIRGS